MNKKKSVWKKLMVLLVFLACYWMFNNMEEAGRTAESENKQEELLTEKIPAYSGKSFYVLNDNLPDFTEDDLTTEAYEHYSKLDRLGRCGVAMACIGQELMPTEPREDIYEIRPTGWDSVMYDIVEQDSLYNRCHLIGFQLTGENANEKNLITGTRYMNTEGMLDFENKVAAYVREKGNHVLYRVTPVFEGNNLVASGVVMEAYSVEDGGEGISFHVYVYNVQPGIVIDYATGASALEEIDPNEEKQFVLNTNSRKFHREECDSVLEMKEWNKDTYTGTRDALLAQGYEPCGSCKP